MYYLSVSSGKHIIISCAADFTHVRNKYVTASSIKQLFEEVDMQNIIDFVKETHFYHRL